MEEENQVVEENSPEQVTDDIGAQQEEQEVDQNQNNAQTDEPASAEPETETPGSVEGALTEEPVQGTESEPTAEDGEQGEPAPETPQSGSKEEGDEQHTAAPVEGEEGATEANKDDTVPPEDEGKENVEQGESGAGEQAEGDQTEGEQAEEGEQQAKPESPKEGEAGEESAAPETGDVAVAEGEEPAAAEGTESAGVEGQENEQTPEDVQTPAEGIEDERAESPVAVGVKLSREGSPSQMMDQDPDQMLEILEPGTPDRVSETGDDLAQQEMIVEDDEEEAEMEPEFDREQLIERYHAAIQERDQLQQQNYQLQHKIAEYFRKKKSDESRQDFDKNVSDQEQRYIKYMANLEELRKQEGQERENYRVQIEELKERCGEKQERVEGERQKFIDFKKQVALNSLNSRSGKPIQPKDIEQYLSTENKKDNDVINVRLENIKLKNKLKKKEQQLKSKEELAEGLHLIDFEQLKIENQTYNEKIEERNEELLKLRKKITSTVQVLTHLKEKLQFVQAENQVQNGRLKEVEAVAAQKRDVLSRTKQARDALRIDNQKLRQNCGLLGNEPLLRDFEHQRDESDDLKMKLESLRMQHAELTLNCNQVRRKIDQVRMSQM